MLMKKIGILGSGAVGTTLANGFIKYKHQVMIGTRDASKLDFWKQKAGDKGSAGTSKETASFGELIVLAVKGAAAKDVLEEVGSANLAGKIIIDATNPISGDPPTNGVLSFFTDQNNSLMEELQGQYPDAHFVKAFNSVGSGLMVNPPFETKPTMFICGNDKSSKKEVSKLLTQFGWETADMGAVEAARAIEPLSMLWCIPGFNDNQWSHAFKLMK
ncbi:MAG: NAD(P)-binding domain-containing protein [Cytophagales bacterium]|nr:NAD(P)-binding domain-containing protein [Cytophagales bacterium]